MPARHFEARVRHQPGAAVLELQGEINAFGSEALNAAYAEAEQHNPEVVLLNFTGVDYINSWHRPDRRAAGQGTRGAPADDCLRPERALRRDLPDYAPVGFHDDLPE